MRGSQAVAGGAVRTPLLPAVKVCGCTRPEDARAAAAAGAAYVGAIFVPGGPRMVSLNQAAAAFAASPAKRVGVFADAPLTTIGEAMATCGLDVIQLHGDESPGEVAAVRRDTGREVWKAVRPRTGAEFIAAIEQFSGVASGLVVDGWSAAARGGTGTAAPWHLFQPLRERVPAGLKLILAGGLRAGNVGIAIELLSPDIVDVSSGVEDAPGQKNAAEIRRFVARTRAVRDNP